MERVLLWLDDLDDLVIRVPVVLQSSHAHRILTLVFFVTLGAFASVLFAAGA
jgi:hypothetical protein